MQEYIFLLQDIGGGSSIGSTIMLLLIPVVFYLFIFRPQQKRAKEERNFREGLSKGDKVKTIGGIFGQVEKIDEESILIKIDNEVQIRVEKSAVRPTTAPAQK